MILACVTCLCNQFIPFIPPLNTPGEGLRRVALSISSLGDTKKSETELSLDYEKTVNFTPPHPSYPPSNPVDGNPFVFCGSPKGVTASQSGDFAT